MRPSDIVTFFRKEKKEDLIKRFNELKQEIRILNEQLKRASEEKEVWYKKKKDLRDQIELLIKEANEIKLKKNKTFGEVKQFKDQRDKYNKEVQDLISQIRDITQKKEDAHKKYGAIDSARIKNKIDELERKIETEALSFKKEQKLMKEINKLKNSYTISTEIEKLVNEMHLVSKAITESKNKANEFHKKLQEFSKEGRDDYTKLMGVSKKINLLDLEQEVAFHNFILFKREVFAINEKLKSLLVESSKLQKKLNDSNITKEQAPESISTFENKNQRISEQIKQVEEKIRSGEKLTNDDIMIFQKYWPKTNKELENKNDLR